MFRFEFRRLIAILVISFAAVAQAHDCFEHLDDLVGNYQFKAKTGGDEGFCKYIGGPLKLEKFADPEPGYGIYLSSGLDEVAFRLAPEFFTCEFTDDGGIAIKSEKLAPQLHFLDNALTISVQGSDCSGKYDLK